MAEKRNSLDASIDDLYWRSLLHIGEKNDKNNISGNEGNHTKREILKIVVSTISQKLSPL